MDLGVVSCQSPDSTSPVSHMASPPRIELMMDVDHVMRLSPNQHAASHEESNDALRHRRRRSRTIYTKLQLESLERVFRTNKYPDINSREALADAVDLSEARVQVGKQTFLLNASILNAE